MVLLVFIPHSPTFYLLRRSSLKLQGISITCDYPNFQIKCGDHFGVQLAKNSPVYNYLGPGWCEPLTGLAEPISDSTSSVISSWRHKPIADTPNDLRGIWDHWLKKPRNLLPSSSYVNGKRKWIPKLQKNHDNFGDEVKFSWSWMRKKHVAKLLRRVWIRRQDHCTVGFRGCVFVTKSAYGQNTTFSKSNS